MTDIVGLCRICGKPATNKCSLCGKLVCKEHFDSKHKMCVTHSSEEKFGK